MTFAGVAGLATLATLGLMIGLPRDIGAGLPNASLRERIAVARRPIVLATLLITALWATGAYTVYTYLSLFLARVTGLAGVQISAVMFLWGLAAAAGVVTGGRSSDRFGPVSVIVSSLTLSGLAFASLSLSGEWLSPSLARVPVLVAIAVWGVAHWAFYPAQQARLIDIAGVKVAAIVLSLNASFMYIGFSLGAALGGLALLHGSVTDLGWVAGLCELAALALMRVLDGSWRGLGRQWRLE
jgi:predicted MFS family arabinose efflux permease